MLNVALIHQLMWLNFYYGIRKVSPCFWIFPVIKVDDEVL